MPVLLDAVGVLLAAMTDDFGDLVPADNRSLQQQKIVVRPIGI